VLPSCNIAAMNLHPAEIAAAVSPGAHATVLLDQAGRHISNRLVLPLPARCPELNAAENLWQFRRDNPIAPIGGYIAGYRASGDRVSCWEPVCH